MPSHALTVKQPRSAQNLPLPIKCPFCSPNLHQPLSPPLLAQFSPPQQQSPINNSSRPRTTSRLALDRSIRPRIQSAWALERVRQEGRQRVKPAIRGFGEGSDQANGSGLCRVEDLAKRGLFFRCVDVHPPRDGGWEVGARRELQGRGV